MDHKNVYCNTSVIPRDNTNNVIGTNSQELQQFELDCPICFDALDTCDVITMDCCKKQIHLKCINRWHIKNINSDTRELCIMCRTKSTLMSDIYNTVRLTIDDEDEDEEYDFIRNPAIRRRRRINVILNFSTVYLQLYLLFTFHIHNYIVR